MLTPDQDKYPPSPCDSIVADKIVRLVKKVENLLHNLDSDTPELRKALAAHLSR